MKKYLQMLKKSVVCVGFLSPINRGVFIISVVFSLSNLLLAEYKPGSLQKSSTESFYEFGLIDTDFCYSFWMDTYLAPLWKSEALVRQSVVPSAMVDWRGDLYTMTFHALSTFDGAIYKLTRYQANGGTIKYTNIKPWHTFSKTINVTSSPSSMSQDKHKRWFDRYVHNAFHACIAQDVSDNCEVISMLWYIPATRHMNDRDNYEGILYQVRKKDDFTLVFEKCYTPNTEAERNVCNQYAWHHIKPRNYDVDKCTFNVETGNFTAASMPASDQSLGNCYTQVCYVGLAREDDNESGRIFNLGKDCVGSDYNVSGLKVYQRYIRWGDRFYGMCSIDGNRFLRTFYFDVSNGFRPFQKFTVDQQWHLAFRSIDHITSCNLDHDNYYEYYTPYNYDFCIVKGNNGSGIMCILGLRAAGLTTEKTCLTSSYNSAWNNNISWGKQDICLVLSSCKLGEQPGNCYENPQNIIYSTGITSGTACNISCGCSGTFSYDYGEKQLFKNTHKCCVYVSSLGSQFIIYCYCYPGKKKQLYLGYARCWVGSDNKVHLGTKMEFKSSNSATTWGDSFGEFTSCARIISMDCKNGHLWITWLDATDYYYKYFHILAKDLVGE